MSSNNSLLSQFESLSATNPRPRHQRHHSSQGIGSLGYLSVSSSAVGELEVCNFHELEEQLEEDLAPRERKAVSQSLLEHPAKQFHSAAPRKRRRFVSWNGVMDLQDLTSLQLSRASEREEGLNKTQTSQRSQRFLQESMQLEDNIPHHGNSRQIYIDDPKRTNDNLDFSGNEIRTSKYTMLTFLPKNLFMQFHRVAYLYFLAIAALNQLPPLAVFGRTVSLFPLLFVLTVTAVKDGYEDWRRHRSDRNENNREALVFQSGEFCPKRWKDIQAGEVVKISADETVPCDMVLLGTSDPSGIAYIQTMNLDGESNLKTRYARQETNKLVLEGAAISGVITCEQPNRNIYEFTANMELKGRRFPLSQSNIILRGCQLKNTEWAVGVVVYAGQDTKAMLNSTTSPSKRSRLETYMNRETLWLSVFLLIMCLVVALGMGFWLKDHESRLDTLPYYRKIDFSKGGGVKYKFYGIPMEAFFSFLSSIIVFQIMIPISLYITMELVRLGQSYFMIGDQHMYDHSSDSRFQCRSLNINEDLGQIQYVFSDKTGTLTENKMEFKKACIWGKSYENASPVVASAEDTDAGVQDTKVGARKWKLKSEITPDPELMKLLYKDLNGDERIAAHEFFLTLAACNTVIPILSESPSDSGDPFGDSRISIDYQGESPDEQALVAAASAYGYTLFERTSGHIAIDVNGEKLRLDVLGLHEFDSVRKRMSVIIQFPDNTVKVLVKGADTSLFSILKNENGMDDSMRNATQGHLLKYSSEGLRTLVVATRELVDAEFKEWHSMYEEASTSLTDRSSKLRQTAALIECNLTLIGATAIEDKLQEGVPETIESLQQAGVKVWVLTGDKQETAISIALSCRLLTAEMHRIIINGNSEDECRKLLCDAKAKYRVKAASFSGQPSKWKRNAELDYPGVSSQTELSNTKEECGSQDDEPIFGPLPLALIIDGNSLVYILEKDLESELFDLASSCRVVLCCRVAPLQKAGIVDLIKCRTDDMTLAIGDGANDVSMIQMADVGVGICGQEGRQAVMASDFAMGQFRFLKRLLLVHGHWNYQRIGYLVLYNFYRNAVFVLMLFWYILYTAFSTTSALTDWSSVFYSVIYTSVPTIFVGVLDKDLSHRTLLKYPKLYAAGHRQESYNLTLFWITMLDTLWQSLVLFYVPFFIYRESSIDIWSMGSLWTIAVVVLVNLHLAMDIKRWVYVTHIAIWGSIIVTYGCMVVLDSIPNFPNYGTIYHLVTSPVYWLAILLIMVIGLLPRFIVKFIHQIFWPSDIQIAREAEILRKRRPFFGSKANSISG